MAKNNSTPNAKVDPAQNINDETEKKVQSVLDDITSNLKNVDANLKKVAEKLDAKLNWKTAFFALAGFSLGAGVAAVQGARLAYLALSAIGGSLLAVASPKAAELSKKAAVSVYGIVMAGVSRFTEALKSLKLSKAKVEEKSDVELNADKTAANDATVTPAKDANDAKAQHVSDDALKAGSAAAFTPAANAAAQTAAAPTTPVVDAKVDAKVEASKKLK
jgi:dienelactone hydrolase